eukprot:CAMPEP_0118681020 /NCGR_PEP_ID=MMETSP0800-20121206/4702_1 /TAXON_ID=210618 ORGANISM="Striatella unipunctata, Strain CCMP2910" /NCGR_SAMPLE_ID=MMETSP0800 /ASSEMBLY_ACC=CAM_ASM_000638 /LENGTH=265 /DNA_ID=CAMNT_0006577261 /DNA_START=13 /DNA_END=810 /DNA_ORIENTATION=+
MTLEVLKATLIGTMVTKLKMHKNPDIATKAKIKGWKQLAKKAGITRTPSNLEGEKQPEKTEKTEEPVWDETLQPFRINICSKLHSILKLSSGPLLEKGFHPDALKELLFNVTSEIEGAINQYGLKTAKKSPTQSFKQVYTEKARSLLFNLKKNDPLREELIQGMTLPTELVNMSADELASPQQAQARLKQVQDLNESRRLDWEQANEDKINEMCGIKGDLLNASLFTCKRCKSIKTTSTQKQTRSADEPMTVFVLCKNCGNRWKC